MQTLCKRCRCYLLGYIWVQQNVYLQSFVFLFLCDFSMKKKKRIAALSLVRKLKTKDISNNEALNHDSSRLSSRDLRHFKYRINILP